jgi:multiple sugar transport system permease protein
MTQVVYRPRRRVAPRINWTDYLFIAPAAIFLLVTMVFPVIFNVLLSFREPNARTLLGFENFVGLSNYAKVLAQEATRATLWNTLVFTIVSLGLQIGLGLALAVFYTKTFPGSRIMRGLYLVAWTIPTVVSGAIFKWLLEEKGVINYLLSSLGFVDIANNPLLWTSDARLALSSVILANVWLGLPFNLTLLVAALEGIPNELYEAGSLDGAVGWQRFYWLTLPMIQPALLSVTILGLIYTFKVFDLVYIITGGGPLGASEVVSTLAFRKLFGQYLYGEGAALLNLLFLLLFALSLVYVRSLNREERA